MPRPSRTGWSPVTLTRSDEVQTALRVQAAATGVEIGKLADEVLRATLEPLFPQVEAIRGGLRIRRAVQPPSPGTTPSPAGGPKVPAVAEPPRGGLGAQPLEPDERYSNPGTRAEVEAKFLSECLDRIEATGMWDELLEDLERENARIHSEEELEESLPMKVEIPRGCPGARCQPAGRRLSSTLWSKERMTGNRPSSGWSKGLDQIKFLFGINSRSQICVIFNRSP